MRELRLAMLATSLVLGCGDESDSTGDASSVAGIGGTASGTGGAAGPSSATGGAVAAGGTVAAGGVLATGGLVAAGGSVAVGGTTASGGTVVSGGAPGAGGAEAAGGAQAAGGTPGSGGVVAAGGTPAAGGAPAAGGDPGVGGLTATGGEPSIGGSVGTGGSGDCPPLADRVQVTTIDAGQSVNANSEYFPIVIAPRTSGGSWAAWRESDTLAIRLASLAADDTLETLHPTFSGEEVHALIGHDDGGALVIVEEDPDIYSPVYCRGPETPDNDYCGKIDVLRFDESATQQWRTTITTKDNVNTAGAGPYVWWYQHTMRLGFENDEYAVFFRAAGSSERPGEPGEVDIHTGDRMHFVSADGVWLEDRGGFCGHSWGIRLAYNGHWGIGCHGDGSPNALRLSVFDRGSAIQTALFGDGTDPTQRALGGLVAVPGGFWLNHIQPGSEMHLSRVDDDANIVYDEVVPEATGLSTNYPFRAYMEQYGTSQLLLGWKSNGQLTLATADLVTGALLEGPVAVNAEIDDYVDFVSFPNGDVVWAFSPGRSSSIDVVRVSACE